MSFAAFFSEMKDLLLGGSKEVESENIKSDFFDKRLLVKDIINDNSLDIIQKEFYKSYFDFFSNLLEIQVTEIWFSEDNWKIYLLIYLNWQEVDVDEFDQLYPEDEWDIFNEYIRILLSK